MTTMQLFSAARTEALAKAARTDMAIFVRKTRSGYAFRFDGSRAIGCACPDGSWMTKADLAAVGIR